MLWHKVMMINILIKVIGLMIKLRNFWVALAIGCAFSMGTSSCGDDDDDEPKQEVNNVVTPTEAGSLMKDIVKKSEEKGSNILAQATSMTKDQLLKLAETVIEYNKNKDNTAWMQSFVAAAASEEAGKEAVELLDEAISGLVDYGVVMDEITTKDLLDVFSEISGGSDQLGEGESAGIKQGESHKALFDAVYEDKLASIQPTAEGLGEMSKVFQTLSEGQQRELISIVVAWSNKSEDQAWKNGFLSGTGLDSASQQGLKEKLDFLSTEEMINIITKF